jgi:hypothetical protein
MSAESQKYFNTAVTQLCYGEEEWPMLHSLGLVCTVPNPFELGK